MPLVAPQTRPVEDLEPLCAGGLRRLLGAFASVPALPVAISLRSFGRILVAGEPATRHGFLRAIVAQLATFHAPDDLRVVVCASADRLADWEWLKWLPHALHPSRCDAAGPLRLVSGDLSVLEVVLDDELRDRPRLRRPGEAATGDLAHLVVIVDGGGATADSDLAAGLHAVTAPRRCACRLPRSRLSSGTGHRPGRWAGPTGWRCHRPRRWPASLRRCAAPAPTTPSSR
jgi:S-DNA-T family DNA segregation ATPase FtsK/SpoIIIE